MRINRSIMLSAVVALAVAAPAAAQRDEGQSPQDIKDQAKTAEFTLTCPDDDDTPDTVTAPFDDKMWPPNHKYQDFTITAFGDDDDSDTVTLTTSVTHDEYVIDWVPDGESEEPTEEVGAGNTRNDASPFYAMGVEDADMDSDKAPDPETGVANFHEVRSERSGRGDGRTYTVRVDADFTDGTEECGGEFTIEVPHDMRSHKAPAKQDKTDSTGPNQG